jgi:predicted ATP-dependent serine protease
VTSAPGSVSQVRECAAQLTRMAKQTGTTILLVGHVTKEGSLAGPRVLEHMVDTVLYFEGDYPLQPPHDPRHQNRFGAVNELGVFVMTETGLKGVSNPSAIFLSSYRDDVPGSCVLVTQEGTRPCWWKYRRWWMTVTACSPNASPWGWSRTGWPCCWRCCTAMAAWPVLIRTYSSTRWAGSRSANRQPTWR